MATRRHREAGSPWHLGKLHFRGPACDPEIVDARGMVIPVPRTLFQSRLNGAADGYLVAFRYPTESSTMIRWVRKTTPAEREHWHRLLEKRARRLRRKAEKLQASAQKPFEPSGVLKHVLSVEKYLSKRRQTKGKNPTGHSVYAPGQGQMRKVGSHRDHTGHH